MHDERNGAAVVAAAVAERIAADAVDAAAAAVDEHIAAAAAVDEHIAAAAAVDEHIDAAAAVDEHIAAGTVALSAHRHVTAAAHSTPETTAAVVRVHLAVAHAVHQQAHHDFAAGPHYPRRANHHRLRVHGGRLSLPVAVPSPVPPRIACPGHYIFDLRTRHGPFLPLRSEIY